MCTKVYSVELDFYNFKGFSFMREQDKEKAILILNQIMELELSGVVRYTHYSLMVYGYHRIPIVNWLKENAQEGLEHAGKAGEMVTMLGGHPSQK